jgi:hypothetical protein
MCLIEKTAPESRRRHVKRNARLLVSFILDGLASAFHVFTKAMCRMAAGENDLADNCNQKIEGRSFQHFHLFYLSYLLVAMLRARCALQPPQQRQDNKYDEEESHNSSRPIPPATAISPGWQYSNQREYQ